MLSGVNSLVSGLKGLVVAEADIEDVFVFVVVVVLVVVFILAALWSVDLNSAPFSAALLKISSMFSNFILFLFFDI
jgi:hypothetical protein